MYCTACLAEGKVWVKPDIHDSDLKNGACVKIPTAQEKNGDYCKQGEPYRCIAGLDENNNYYSISTNSYKDLSRMSIPG